MLLRIIFLRTEETPNIQATSKASNKISVCIDCKKETRLFIIVFRRKAFKNRSGIAKYSVPNQEKIHYKLYTENEDDNVQSKLDQIELIDEYTVIETIKTELAEFEHVSVVAIDISDLSDGEINQLHDALYKNFEDTWFKH